MGPTAQPIIGLSDDEVDILASTSIARWCGEKFDTILKDRHDAAWLEGYTEVIESIADQLEDYIFVGLRRTQIPRITCKNCAHDMLDHTQDEIIAGPNEYDPESFDLNPCDIEINMASIVTTYCSCEGFSPVEDLTAQSG